MDRPPSFFEHSRFIGATPDRVWRAITVPDELNCWLTVHAEVDLRPGGLFRFYPEYGLNEEGRFVEVDPPHRLVIQWVHPHDLNGPSEEEITAVRTLVPVEDGTKLCVRATGFGVHEEQQYIFEGMTQGYEKDTINLKNYLETGRDTRPMIWPGIDFGVRYITLRERFAPEVGVSHGAYCFDVYPDGPAGVAGLLNGDVVVSFDGIEVRNYRELWAAVSLHHPGDRVQVEFFRDKRRQFADVTLANAKDEACKRRRFEALVRQAERFGSNRDVAALEAFQFGTRRKTRGDEAEPEPQAVSQFPPFPP